MPTITVVSSKGGVGKSTTAVTVARLLAEGTRVKPLLLDIDEQAATEAFKLRRVEVLRCGDMQTRRHIQTAGARPVIIDCPPSLEKSKTAIALSTLVIVPAPCDFLSFRGSLSALDELQDAGVDARLLLTMYDPADTKHQENRRDVQAELSDSVFKTVIFRRRAVAHAVDAGQTIVDFAPESAAARQYRALVEEIKCLL